MHLKPIDILADVSNTLLAGIPKHTCGQSPVLEYEKNRTNTVI